MKFDRFYCTFVSFVFYGLFSVSVLFSQESLQLGTKREIFIDTFLISELDNVSLVMHQPQNKGAVIDFDNPWEGNFSAYCTVIRDDQIYRMYYRGVREAGVDGNNNEVTCYAESTDGINWSKPKLGIHTVQGSNRNNVVLANAAPATHNFSPFLDTNPKAKKSERYKAIGGVDRTGLIAYVSEDGVRWNRLRDTPIFKKGVFDSQNVVFWSEHEQQYICYFRTWSDGGFTEYKGFRTVSRTVSKDFINWSDPEHMVFGDTPMEHLYTHQTAPYIRAPHIYLAIGARFMPNRQVLSDDHATLLNVSPQYYKDCSDVVLMSSRGGNQYDRTFMESFIRPGIGLQNWVSRSNYPVLNVVQTSEEELSIYVNENYAQPTAHIKRYTLRLDGFTSLRAPYDGGEVLTKLLAFDGSELELNYSSSAAGSICVEIQDVNGVPISGFALDDCQPIIGNEIKRIVQWKDGTNVSKLANQPIRLRFVMKDADLFSVKFN